MYHGDEMKILIKICVILFSIIICMKQVDLKKGSTSNSQTKKCNRNEFETIFSRIVVFGDPVRKFPETIAERSKYCTYVND